MIEVGEYVRNKDGKILKIDSFEKDLRNIEVVCFATGEVYTRQKLNEIIKTHSKNIIDLIEVGDYVNGKEVEEICSYDKDGNDKYELGICEIDCEDVYYIPLKDIEIKSIVPKEQFESMKYKVEDD